MPIKIITTKAESKLSSKVISISNRKGGVGKTTLTTVMAEELANAGYSVVMLDLDSQTDLTDINLSQNENSNLFDLLTGQKALEDVIVELPGSGDKKIIPGSARVDEIQTGVSNTLAEIIEKLKEIYDFVLLDHPPSLTELSRAGYIVSDELLIIAEAQQLSLKNLVNFLLEIKQLQLETETKLEVLGIVANKVDLRRKLTERMLAEYKRTYPNLFFENYIGVDTAIPNAQFNQETMRELPWRARTLSQFERVIEEMIQRLQ
ncbi:chromosome partitioning protein [Halanaerobium saccharolyticum]|uniref:Chromosome partitioning protein n=1 Tax=Halanaerobium saccharolyticum TaxID=43595 RepID=A0A4R6RHI2_9FIRM|nr:ParA family protein [Halanaerobium saccharolyticum]TDP85635.1 chromosome partitioning protein [Halanaerobium saccharolyticum]